MRRKVGTYTEHNGLGRFDEFVQPVEVSPEHRAKVVAWYRVWHSLSKAQQDAWQQLNREEKDATYKMDAETFLAFMGKIRSTNDPRRIGKKHRYGLYRRLALSPAFKRDRGLFGRWQMVMQKQPTKETA